MQARTLNLSTALITFVYEHDSDNYKSTSANAAIVVLPAFLLGTVTAVQSLKLP